MNQNICKTVINNKAQFIPLVFTEKQVMLMQKYIQSKILTPTEKTYLYSTIKNKISALQLLKEEWHIRGNNMIPERIEYAKQILQELNAEKAFISGSFLFAKEYNDIDIFIVGKKRKNKQEGKKHFIYINEENLTHPIYYSCLLYSVSTFSIGKIRPNIKRPDYGELVLTYERAITEILDNDDQKMVRDLLFEYHLQIKKEVLDSFSLQIEFDTIKKMPHEQKINLINSMIKNMLLHLYSKRYVYYMLSWFVTQLKQDIKKSKTNENLIIYHTILGDIKNECRGTQATA